jgi:hypothetical protein
MLDSHKTSDKRDQNIFGMIEENGSYKIGELNGKITDQELIDYSHMRFNNIYGTPSLQEYIHVQDKEGKFA